MIGIAGFQFFLSDLWGYQPHVNWLLVPKVNTLQLVVVHGVVGLFASADQRHGALERWYLDLLAQLLPLVHELAVVACGDLLETLLVEVGSEVIRGDMVLLPLSKRHGGSLQRVQIVLSLALPELDLVSL
jgi:hypothetical protein